MLLLRVTTYACVLCVVIPSGCRAIPSNVTMQGDYVPLEVGNSWTYEGSLAGRPPGGTWTTTLEITKVRKSPDNTYYDWRRVSENPDEGTTLGFYSAREDGIYSGHIRIGLVDTLEEVTHPVWTDTLARGEPWIVANGRIVSHGEEQLTVPAGTFTSVHVEPRLDPAIEVHLWYAKGVGLIRSHVNSGYEGGYERTIELVSWNTK